MDHNWNDRLRVETPNIRSFGGPWCSCPLGYSLWHTLAAGALSRETAERFLSDASDAGTNRLLEDLSEVVVRPWIELSPDPHLDLHNRHAVVAAHCRNKNVMQICVMLNSPLVVGRWPDFDTRYLHRVIRAFIAESIILCRTQARSE